MTPHQDAYWDELGLAWTAINPDVKLIASHLQVRLRRQTVFTALVIFAGLPLCLAGFALGGWTVWHGVSAEAWFFVTRGIAIAAISLLTGLAAWSFTATWGNDTQSLRAMIELSLSRAQKWLMAIRLAFACLVIAAVFGMAGYGLRVQAGKPPVLSPIEPLILLALLGLVFFLLQRKARDDIGKYRYLKQLLLEEKP